MSAILTLTCALALMVTACRADLVTLTAKQKQEMLDLHNKIRSNAALGNIYGMPVAANMPILEWDDRLMEKANSWVKKCQLQHSSMMDRAQSGYFWVGENIGLGSHNDFISYMQSWYAERHNYVYSTGGCKPGTICGGFGQIIWAETTLIGCGMSHCPHHPHIQYIIVCHYAAGGNFPGQKPYIAGTAATQCPADYTFKKDGLCMRKDQCTGQKCTCTLTSCPNGATLDSVNCKCDCPSGSTDCKATLPKDTNVVNKDNVIARVP